LDIDQARYSQTPTKGEELHRQLIAEEITGDIAGQYVSRLTENKKVKLTHNFVRDQLTI